MQRRLLLVEKSEVLEPIFKNISVYVGLGYGLLAILFVAIHGLTKLPTRDLMRDPLGILNQPFYLGFMSNIGVLLWAATVAICFFSVVLNRKLQLNAFHQKFFLFSGLFTGFLLLDDLFMLHEAAASTYLGIKEGKFLLVSTALFLLYFLSFRKVFLTHRFRLFALAITLFAVSICIDAVVPRLWPAAKPWLNDNTGILLEDGTKLFGIFTWLMYFATVAAEAVILPVRRRFE